MDLKRQGSARRSSDRDCSLESPSYSIQRASLIGVCLLVRCLCFHFRCSCSLWSELAFGSATPSARSNSRRRGPVSPPRFVVLGAGGVGKSALTCRFVNDVFLDAYDPTIEEQFSRDVVVDGELSKLEVLDTAGAEQFTALSEVYIKSGMGFVLVFSLTQIATLREVDILRQQINRIKGGNAKVPIVVVGTKSDLTAEREVGREAIQKFADHWGLPFYETSAKKNLHVNDAFEDLVRQMRERYPAPPKRKGRFGSGKCIIM